MRFFRPRGARFRPDWDRVPASIHPKSEMPESIMLVYRMPRQSTLQFFNRTLSYLRVHRRQNERQRTTGRVKFNVRQTVFQCRSPRKSRPKASSNHFYHSALFVSPREKFVEPPEVSQSGVLLDNWLVHTSMYYCFIVGGWRSWQAVYGEKVIYFILIIAKIKDKHYHSTIKKRK